MKSPLSSRSDERETPADEALRGAPQPRMNPFTERRIRTAVLRGATTERPREGAGRARVALLAVGLAVAASVVGALTLGRDTSTAGPPSEPGEAAPAAAGNVDVTASADAEWRREVVGATERIVVSSGRMTFAVRHHELGHRLVVATPDGEIEDVGTVFTVVVENARTEHIAVSEGAVVFRRPGLPTVRLEAGGRYDASDASAAIDPIAPAGSAAGIEPSGPPVAAQPKAPMAAAAPPPSPTAGSGAVAATPAVDGAEDTAYLQIVALLREGRDEEAKVAARDYLRRFPAGFRRVEVVKIAQ